MKLTRSSANPGPQVTVSLVAYVAWSREGLRMGMCYAEGIRQETGAIRIPKPEARREEATLTGALAPTKPLTALDVCDRCGAQAYVRVLLANSGELLFCAHHGRLHAEALAKVAVDIQDESNRLSEPLPH